MVMMIIVSEDACIERKPVDLCPHKEPLLASATMVFM